ncbi:MAG: M48 family metalloprotease [Candidatus Eremiobacteraeota bacterium]|nr:M48 family metalloprotease [Candidatus Eremiobacteraeota bacterium]
MAAFTPDIGHLVDAIYPPARQALAIEVAALARGLFWLGSLVQLVIFAALYFTGAASAVRTGLESAFSRVRYGQLLTSALIVAAVVVASSVIALPFTWYDSFVFPHRFDLSRETPADWFHDWAVGIALGASIAAVGGALFFALVRRFERRWPLIAAALAIPLVVLSSIVLPVWIEPLFNTYTPLPPSPLTRSILDLARAHGVNASAVYVFNLSKQETSANAFVSGIGPSERIAISDTLLKSFAPDEALYVTAHELGHYVHGDLWRGTFYGWVAVLAALAYIYYVARPLARRWPRLSRGLDDPACTPLVLALALLFALALQPVGNALSRTIEHNADVFAAQNTHLGSAGVRAFARLGSQSLAPLHPRPAVVWYFYTHPPLDQRIEYAAEHAGLTTGTALPQN